MAKIQVYHAGFQEIRRPDIHHGRKNADFGQGFYLTSEREFSERWAKIRQGNDSYINCYELDLDGLRVRSFERDVDWFDYIYSNRRMMPDSLEGTDVVAGPIANDIIYDVLGITTSGFLTREQSLKLFLIGPVYRQIALKTEKAADHLRFLSSEIVPPERILSYREIIRAEEKEYQELFANKLSEITKNDL